MYSLKFIYINHLRLLSERFVPIRFILFQEGDLKQYKMTNNAFTSYWIYTYILQNKIEEHVT